MADKSRRIAIFPGTFDPITNGHIDVIRRGAVLFDELVVGVGDNPEKSVALIDQNDRMQIISSVISDIPNVIVKAFSGLTVDFARDMGACVILRGIRDQTDFHFESRAALTNKQVAGIETVFIMTSGEYAFISSTLIRQIASSGRDVSGLVPPQVLPYLSQTS
jgi:pantetheine-phosphate adenylyltransferase